jgi:predicted DNA-binding protein (UPF0278 family)
MVIPQQLACDFCQLPIAEGVRYGSIKMPIPPSLRRELLDYAEQEVVPRVQQSPFGVMLSGADSIVPSSWSVEICTDCAFGLIPDLRDKLTTQIRSAIARAVAAKRRHLDSLDSLEEEPHEG